MRRLAFISALFVSVLAYALPTKSTPPYQPGEYLHYGLHYQWGAVKTEVAQADFSLTNCEFNGQDALHLDMQARTMPFFDVFFKVREHFQSWFTPDGHTPLQFWRDTYEGGYTAVDRYTYDWEQRVIHADVNFGGRGDEHYEIPLTEKVFDFCALLYFFRTIDWTQMEVGDTFPLDFAIDEDVFEIKITYEGRELKKIPRLGKVNTLRFACTLLSGAVFDGKEQLMAWISDDDARLLLAFMAPIRVGHVWGYLKKWEGLKYPFDARVVK